MTPTEIRACIRRAARACIEKDADAFASLFLAEGEIVLSRDRLVGQTAIAQATAAYFTTCEAIAIDIRRILVDGSSAVVEWSWQDCNAGKEECNSTDNAIVIDFQDDAIARWREYRS